MKKSLLFIILLSMIVNLSSCISYPQPSPQSPTSPTVPTATTVQNNTPKPDADIKISTVEQLKNIASDDSFDFSKTICITAPLTIDEEIIFTKPVSISINASLNSYAPISINTYLKGNITIIIGENINITQQPLSIDAPYADVTWSGTFPYDTTEQFAYINNVGTLNGINISKQYSLGGKGKERLTSFTNSSNNLDWSIYGNAAYLTVSYLISDKLLKNIEITTTTDYGKTTSHILDLTKPCTIAITDEEGNIRNYKIVTDRITYNLPVFYINTENSTDITSKEDYLRATLKIDTTNSYGSFPCLPTSNIFIRGRGHYSWKFDKKSYKIRFEEKTSVMSMNASKNWVLIANYTDRSLIQNHVALEMGKVLDNIPYHSSQYPVDVFVNGEYRGVYTFGEQLEAKEERINLEENYQDTNTDYLLEVGGYDDGDISGRDYFHTSTLKYVSIKHPDTTKFTKEQYDYISNYVKKADEAVRNLENYEEYIDVDSLIDWVIIHELTYNLDCCFRRSCYMIKEKDGKLKMGPIWDFDLAFGSFYRYEEGDWATIGSEGGYVGVTWMNYLKNDPVFMEKFAARWNEKKDELLNAALTVIDTASTNIAPSAEMNFEVWDILGIKIPSQSESHNKYDTYQKMVQRLKNFIQDRYTWLCSELE